MTQTTHPLPATGAPAPATSLTGRLIGVLISPRATYARIAERPAVLGAFVVILGVMAALTTWFLLTEVGRNAVLDRQFEFLQRLERMGIRMPPEAYAQMERDAAQNAYWSAGGQVVTGVVAATALAGILLVVFNFGFGLEARYKQVLAVVVHSWTVMAVSLAFATPLNYAQGSLVGRSSLLVFMPFLDDSSFLAHLAGLIDLFWIWWVVNLSIGIGVLYKMKTGPIAASLMAVYGVGAVAFAAVAYRFSGA